MSQPKNCAACNQPLALEPQHLDGKRALHLTCPGTPEHLARQNLCRPLAAAIVTLYKYAG